MFRMSDTVIRLIERRSVGDKYILVSLHINNFFFTFGKRVWQLVEGFPMGVACGPSFADIYLAYYEFGFALRQFKAAEANWVVNTMV